MTRHGAAWAGSACLALAVLLGAALTWILAGDVPAVDAWWSATIAGMRTDAAAAAASVLDRIGGGWVAILVIPAVIVAGLLLARRPAAALLAAGAFAASALVVQALKHLFDRVRPEDMLVLSDHGSFPSGHAANAATIAVVMWMLFPRLWVGLAGVLWVLVMAWSRTMLSAHWLTDVIGGVVLGAGVALLGAAVAWPWIRMPRHPPPVTAPNQAR